MGQQFIQRTLILFCYFLGIEIALSSQVISLSQRKYMLDLLSETGLLVARPVDTLVNSIVELDGRKSDLFPDVGDGW